MAALLELTSEQLQQFGSVYMSLFVQHEVCGRFCADNDAAQTLPIKDVYPQPAEARSDVPICLSSKLQHKPASSKLQRGRFGMTKRRPALIMHALTG